MAIGMTADEYWNGTPFLAVSYREARRIQVENSNADAWWQAFYIGNAVHSALSRSLPWFKKPVDYPKQPYRVTPLTKEEKEEQAQKEREKAIRSLTAWKDAWDRQHGK